MKKKSIVLGIIFALALSGLCTTSSSAATVYKPNTDMGSNAVVENNLVCDDDTKGYYITSVKEYKPGKKLVNVRSGDIYVSPEVAYLVGYAKYDTAVLTNRPYICYCGAWREVITANDLEYKVPSSAALVEIHSQYYHELLGWNTGGCYGGGPTQSTQIYFKDTLYEQDGYKKVKK